MCGRYAFALSNEEIYDGLQAQLPRMFERGRPRFDREQDYRPGNYNVAPRQRMPIIHRDPQDSSSAVIHTAQWGLIPHWTKHPPTAALNTINARSESIIDPGSGGMWNALKNYKRCIIPAQGYYEWQKKGPNSKVVHFTRIPPPPSKSSKHKSQPDSTTKSTTDPLMFFAGLYDTVKYASPVESSFKPTNEEDTREPYPTGNPVPLTTFTILTTSPPKEFMWLHDRMPCILTSWEDIERWLDLGEEQKGWEDGKGGTGEMLTGISGLESYPVPPEVGKISTNSPTYIQPVSQRADGIKAFFQKQSPAKPKALSNDLKEERNDDDKEAVKKEEPISRINKDDEEKGLGDESNAPNPDVKEEEKPSLKAEQSTPGKRKREESKKPVKDEEESPVEKKRAGHQIAVNRETRASKGKKKEISMDDFVTHTSVTSSSAPGNDVKKENGSSDKDPSRFQVGQTPCSSTFLSHAQPYIDQDPDTRLWSCVDLLSGKESAKKDYAMIILNQPITHEDIFFRIWQSASYRLCADGGANRLFDLFGTAAQRKRYLPDMIKGDLDSLRDNVKEFYRKNGVEIQKDGDEYSTDLMKCIQEVEKREEKMEQQMLILLIGGLSGRVDQTVHTMSILHKLRKKRKETYVLNAESLAWVLDEGSHVIEIDHETMGQTCGILPIGVDTAHVKTEGLKWDVDWDTSLDGNLSTSNHLLPENPVVHLKTNKPILWCLEIRDPLPAL